MKDATRLQYVHLHQCRSCKHDRARGGCDILNEGNNPPVYNAVGEWGNRQRWRNGYPRQDADGCPGWELQPSLSEERRAELRLLKHQFRHNQFSEE